MSANNKCYSRCRDFSCTKKAMSFRGKSTWCNWSEGECEPAKCTYATCFKRLMLNDGVCGLTVKRKTKGDSEPEDYKVNEIQTRGKLAKKVGDRSIF